MTSKERYCGVEDEFRITSQDDRGVLADELIAASERFFYNESAHVPIFQPEVQAEVTAGRFWTWYGGTIYHDYDEAGSLIEATTPLTPVTGGIESLVQNVLAQRAQLVELGGKAKIRGVSTHLNFKLDSEFHGDDLCRFETPVPSNAFVSVSAQKLGADIALVAAHTISPVIALLLFNRLPRKGALYRPRKSRRMELCLPYVTEPDQMRAGFAFWFAMVDYITDLIKADLERRHDWQERFRSPAYYKLVLARMPHVVTDVKFQRPSYYLGYQLGSPQEVNVMENGSSAVVGTESGPLGVIDLARRYVDLLSNRIAEAGGAGTLALLQEYLGGRRRLQVDTEGEPASILLDHAYIERAAGASVPDFLNRHRVGSLPGIHLKFLRAPSRIINPYSLRLPKRIIRNLGRELDWEYITLEVVEEDEYTVRQHVLEVPLAEVDEYLRAEDYAGTPFVFLAEIRRWTKATNETPNPRAIFAYGTLMRPEENERRFGARVVAVSKAHAYGKAYDFGDYPVMIENPGGGIVPGVLLILSNFEETAARFDVYEGVNEPCPVFFRSLREVTVEGFRRVTAWVYLGNANNRYVRDKLKKAAPVVGMWSKAGMRHGPRVL